MLLIIYTIIAALLNNSVMFLILPMLMVACITIGIIKINHKYYPWLIFSISISLLLQTTLLSKYLTGSDIIVEHMVYNFTIDAGYWDLSIPILYNSSAVLTILFPIYHFFLGVDGIWLFKIVSSILFAMAPVALYLLYSRVVGNKLALVSVFLFVSIPTFSLEMIAIIRQQAAMLLFVLSLLVLFTDKIEGGKRTILLTLLTAGTIVAHYAMGILLLAVIIFVLFVLLFVKRFFSGCKRERIGWLSSVVVFSTVICLIYFYFAASGVMYKTIGNAVSSVTEQSIVTDNVISEKVRPPVIVEIPIKQSTIEDNTQNASFNSVVDKPYSQISDTPENRILDEMNRESKISVEIKTTWFDKIFGEKVRSSLLRGALGLDFASVSVYGKIFRVIQYIMQLFIIVGLLLFVMNRRMRMRYVFISILILFLLMIITYIFSPILSGYMGITRFYLVAMIPFVVIIIYGMNTIIRKINKIKRYSLLIIVLLFIIPFVVFNSGIIFDLVGFDNTDKIEVPYSISISNTKMDVGGIFTDSDYQAARVLRELIGTDGVFASDFYSTMIVMDNMIYTNMEDMHYRMRLIPWDVSTLSDNIFIFLRERNTMSRVLSFYVDGGLRKLIGYDNINFDKVLSERTLLYDNNGARIYSPTNDFWERAKYDADKFSAQKLLKIYSERPMEPILYPTYWQCPICLRSWEYGATYHADTGLYICPICGFSWSKK